MTTFNEYNHNDRGEPHPQYNKYKTFATAYYRGSVESWVCIFSGNFQKDPNKFPIRDREYNRLLYSATLYTMTNDNTQRVVDLTFYAMAAYNGTFLCDISSRVLLGSATKFKMYYKKTSQDPLQYTLKVYARVNYSNEKIRIQPKIYEVVQNFDVPYHLNAAKQGVNTYESLCECHKNLLNEKFLTAKELEDQMVDWNLKESTCELGYIKTNGINIASENDGDSLINFTHDGASKGKLMYNNQYDSFVWQSDNINTLRSNFTLIPLQKGDFTPSVGLSWARYNRGYFNNGVILGTISGKDDLPELADEYYGLTLFDRSIKKSITFVVDGWVDQMANYIYRISSSGVVTVDNVVITSFKLYSSEAHSVNDTITLSAEAIGNGDIQYKFVSSFNGEHRILSDYGICNNCSWTPEEAGEYELTVYGKDSTGLISNKSLRYAIN